MKNILFTTILAASAVSAASAANVLWDYGTVNITTTTDFVTAGVTEDISGDTVINAGGGAAVTAGGVTVTLGNYQAQANPTGLAYSGAGLNLMSDYVYMRSANNATTIDSTMVISGLSAILDAGQEYSLYIWGKGDSVNQYSSFTFDGDTQIVNTTLDSKTEGADNFFVKYTFTTAAGTAADSLNLEWDKHQTNDRYAAINGFAIVATVPEPSSTALLGLGGLALILRRRRA